MYISGGREADRFFNLLMLESKGSCDGVFRVVALNSKGSSLPVSGTGMIVTG